MTPNEEISTAMYAVINDLALRFALQDEDEVVDAIKRLRVGMIEEYGKMFSDSADEADALACRVLTCVVARRHDLERMGSVVSRAVH